MPWSEFLGQTRLNSVLNCRVCRKNEPPAEFISSLLKLSGSTRVGQARLQSTVLVMMTRSSAITLGSVETLDRQVIPSAAKNRMLGACTTCTAMFGSGVKIGLVVTRAAWSGIRLVLHRARHTSTVSRARYACTVAAVGSTSPRFVGRRAAAGSGRRTALSAWAFVFA